MGQDRSAAAHTCTAVCKHPCAVEKSQKAAEKNSKAAEKSAKAQEQREKAKAQERKAKESAAKAAEKSKKREAQAKATKKEKAAKEMEAKAGKAKKKKEKSDKESAAKVKAQEAAKEKKSKIPPADPCKKYKAQEAANKAMTKTLQKSIRFEPGSTVLTKQGKKTLDEVAAVVVKYAWMALDLTGQSTASGSGCQRLVTGRAKAASEYLKNKGCTNAMNTGGKCKTFIGLTIAATSSAKAPKGCRL